MSKWQGEGWYTFGAIDEDGYVAGGATEAVWVEDELDFDDCATVADGFESIVEFYGDGDLPNENITVAERFVAYFTPEQATAYEERIR